MSATPKAAYLSLIPYTRYKISLFLKQQKVDPYLIKPADTNELVHSSYVKQHCS